MPKTLEPFVLVNGLTSFSDFAIASGNLAPSSFNLLLPVNEDTLTDLSAALEFVWQPAVDVNGDSVTYSLRIYGGTGLDTTMNVSADTASTFNGNGLLEHASEYHWQVVATDGAYTTGSSDTFRFFTPRSVVNAMEGLSGTPEAFSLEQNYPNPFNPSTRINFNIARQNHVIVRIYDVLGREIANLVNENMIPGAYSVDFNAFNLSSRIYFFQLQAGAFVQTKKMTLIP